ncbi:MAG: ATP-binding cassette domain-containing protein [Methanomassiliicoccales archaeon]|nr:ATP-binding cassette domain-containing protein [Methanomassiliicoccales archaeon]
MEEVLIEARSMKKHFPIRGGILKRQLGNVRAVDGIDLAIKRGQTVGLVGESGCGKTTAGRCMLNLIPPTEGHVFYRMPFDIRKRLSDLEEQLARIANNGGEGTSSEQIEQEIEEIESTYALDLKDTEDMRRLRQNMQIVFQDPFSSLNPRMLIRDIVGEPLLVHGVAKGEEMRERMIALLERVGLNPEHLYRYPHEFSGGQRQRIGIARALVLNPEFIVLDEPTSALDVSVQAQILNLLNDLQEEFNLTYLFISHDLSTIRYMCDFVNVMYLGKIVESASKNELFRKPMHPYTEALLSVIPVPDPDLKRDRIVLTGDIPSPANPPAGCRFHTRCRYREAICEEKDPPLEDKGGGHLVACHFR